MAAMILNRWISGLVHISSTETHIHTYSCWFNWMNQGCFWLRMFLLTPSFVHSSSKDTVHRSLSSSLHRNDVIAAHTSLRYMQKGSTKFDCTYLSNSWKNCRLVIPPRALQTIRYSASRETNPFLSGSKAWKAPRSMKKSFPWSFSFNVSYNCHG